MGRCAYIKPDGEQCKNNAVNNTRFCRLVSHRERDFAWTKMRKFFGSWTGRVTTVVGLVLGVLIFWPRVEGTVSDPREARNASTASVGAKNIGLIPLKAVTIRFALKRACTRGAPMCNPPVVPPPNRYEKGVFSLDLKALGTHDLGIDQHFSYPIDNVFRYQPTPNYPDPTQEYIDAAIVIDYEVPIFHWHRTKVCPMYTGRHGEWEWG